MGEAEEERERESATRNRTEAQRKMSQGTVLPAAFAFLPRCCAPPLSTVCVCVQQR